MASIYKRGSKDNKNKKGIKYRIAWFDHTGKRQDVSSGTTDKATAERIAAKYEADAALRREGVIDAMADNINKESQKSIEFHLSNYRAKLQAANLSWDHVNRTIRFIRKISESSNFNTLSDISADGVNRYAANLKNEGRAARTIAAHLTSIKSFTKWLTENRKLTYNPLDSVKKPNPKTDRRRVRRSLQPNEWRRLESVTLVGTATYGMSGKERYLLYNTAIQTGLRSAELRSLTLAW